MLRDLPEALHLNIVDATNQVRREVRQWSETVLESIEAVDVTPKDYNPPRYPGNSSEESRIQAEESQSYLMSLQTSLYGMNNTFEVSKCLGVTEFMR